MKSVAGKKLNDLWNKFEKSNSMHDFSRWALSIEDGHLKRVTWVFNDGVEVDLDSRKNKTFLAFMKSLKLKKADQ